jgi:hypothetical protein
MAQGPAEMRKGMSLPTGRGGQRVRSWGLERKRALMFQVHMVNLPNNKKRPP